jgi:serine/threonine protein kinase
VEFKHLEGRVLAGRFELGGLLGAGGYGAVFEAEQLSIGRRCAVKVLRPSQSRDDNSLQRFKAEAVATSRLTHTNSVIIYDFGRDEEHEMLFLAMEYLEGRNLNDILKEDGPLPLEPVVHIVEQIGKSLDEAHEQGLVHRDMKPHNVMVLERGDDPWFVKVIDFGIAKIVQEETGPSPMSQLTMTGMMIGTPTYMAPEQIRGGSVDGRTDQYAVAISVYKMLTGTAPFHGGTPMEVACQHLSDRPLPIRTYDGELPVGRRFERVLLKALSKEPEDRFSTMGEFARALRLAADSAGDSAVETTPGPPARNDEPRDATADEAGADAPGEDIEAEPRRERVTTAETTSPPDDTSRDDDAPDESDGGSPAIRKTLPLGDATELRERLAADRRGPETTASVTPRLEDDRIPDDQSAHADDAGAPTIPPEARPEDGATGVEVQGLEMPDAEDDAPDDERRADERRADERRADERRADESRSSSAAGEESHRGGDSADEEDDLSARVAAAFPLDDAPNLEGESTMALSTAEGLALPGDRAGASSEEEPPKTEGSGFDASHPIDATAETRAPRESATADDRPASHHESSERGGGRMWLYGMVGLGATVMLVAVIVSVSMLTGEPDDAKGEAAPVPGAATQHAGRSDDSDEEPARAHAAASPPETTDSPTTNSETLSAGESTERAAQRARTRAAELGAIVVAGATRASRREPGKRAADAASRRSSKRGWGTLIVRVVPWGTLHVRGRTYRGRVSTVRLPAGRHTLVVKQDGARKLSKQVDVEAGKRDKITLSVR